MSEIVSCLQHHPRQHRDGKPPWCPNCGMTKDFESPVSRFNKAEKKELEELEGRLGIKKDAVVQLANGDDVPVYLIEALNELEKTWPGATLPQARPAIVARILKAQRKRK